MIPLPLIETNSMTILQHNNHNTRMNDNKRSLPLQDEDAPVSRKRPRTQHCRVRFHDASNVSYPNTTITKEDCRSLWYAQPDYDEFRRSTTSHLRNAWQTELMAQQPASQTSSQTFSAVVQTVYNQCTATTKTDPVMVLSPHDTKQLQTLFAVDDNRLEHVGLERVLARAVGKDRVMRRKRLALLVRQVQQKLNHNKKDEAFKSWAHRSKEDILRGVCEEVSRTSRLFAQCLAYASLQCENC